MANARDEHASAIEWLNNHTDDNVSFFLIEIHAYKIGDSAPAPMFKIVEQPNDFVKSAKALAEKGELNETQKYRLDFWTKLNDLIDERGKPFNKHKPSTDHWYTVAVGSSKAIPHEACAAETQIYFSSDCIEFLKAYYRMVRKLCVI